MLFGCVPLIYTNFLLTVCHFVTTPPLAKNTKLAENLRVHLQNKHICAFIGTRALSIMLLCCLAKLQQVLKNHLCVGRHWFGPVEGDGV